MELQKLHVDYILQVIQIDLVFNVNDLEKLDPKTDGVRFAHGVGTKKRKEIIIKAIEKKFKVF